MLKSKMKRKVITILKLQPVNSNTKCNFEQWEEAKDDLVSKASRPPSQSSHDL